MIPINLSSGNKKSLASHVLYKHPILGFSFKQNPVIFNKVNTKKYYHLEN